MSMMIELRPEAGPALVVGGGPIGLRKAKNLSDGGFACTVVAVEALPELKALAGVTVIERAFQDSDIAVGDPWSLVFACTGDREVNRRVGELARARNIPVVVTDAQAESTFFTPAVLRDGALTVGVSTSGASPAMAKLVRERIATALGPGWQAAVEAARAERSERGGMARTGNPEE